MNYDDAFDRLVDSALAFGPGYGIAADYGASLEYMLQSEGGYTNHPSDPGGPTNFGITIADYRMYVKPNATADDIRNMSLADAKKIYRAKYWDALRCDELPAGVDYTVFDFGVNSGISRSARYLRMVLGLKPEPASITNGVLTALAIRNPIDVIDQMNDARLQLLKGLKTWPVFGKGWKPRVDRVRADSIKMAKAVKPIVPPPPDIPAPKPVPTQPAASGLFAALINLLKAIFKRR